MHIKKQILWVLITINSDTRVESLHWDHLGLDLQIKSLYYQRLDKYNFVAHAHVTNRLGLDREELRGIASIILFMAIYNPITKVIEAWSPNRQDDS